MPLQYTYRWLLQADSQTKSLAEDVSTGNSQGSYGPVDSLSTNLYCYPDMAFVSIPYRQTVSIQKVVFQRITEEKDGKHVIDNRTLAMLARAFKECEELKLRLRMKPAPKPIDVSADHQKKRKSKLIGPTE